LGVSKIIIHVPVWTAGDRPVAFAGILANRDFFRAHFRAPSDGNPIRGRLGCSSRPPAAEAQCIYGKSSGVVNSPAGDNATFLLVAALMAGVAISDRAFESTASAIH
jgi:hypothetical protein